MSHRACPSCGRYRGRVVVDLAQKAQTRMARRQKKAAAEGRDLPTGKAGVGNKTEAQK